MTGQSEKREKNNEREKEISALKTSIPSALRRPKICSVLRDFICESELNRKYAVSLK